jgi:hypothetical protein
LANRLVVAASARRRRLLVPRAPVVAAWAASGVTERRADGHRKRQACKDAREDLTSRDLHLPPSLPPRIGRAAGGASRATRLDAPRLAKSRLRTDHPSAERSTSSAPAGRRCDFCRRAYARFDGRRLVWDAGAVGDLVLAELCDRCASSADGLLDAYAGHGRASMRLVAPNTADAPGLVLLRRTSGALVRTAIYVAIALATFFVVTLLTTRR